jgi:hypothetical protein
MTIIEIRQYRNRWKCFEAPGVEPIFLEKNQAIRKFPNFPRNLAPEFTHYLSERPEMSSQDESSPKAKTRKRE